LIAFQAFTAEAQSLIRLQNQEERSLKKDAEQPQNLLGTHHRETHGDGALSAAGQSRHDQLQRIFTLARAKDSLRFIALALISAELLFVHSIDFWIFWWSAQSFARETNTCSRTEVPVLGIDIDTINADSLEVAAVVLLGLLGLRNQVIAFVVRVPAEPMQERKSILNGDTDSGSEFDCSPA
jgi:hypothetical protein